MKWCTTWCPWADTLELAWCLPTLDRILTPAQCNLSPGKVNEAKTQAAMDVLESGRRLIWTDDMAVPAEFSPLHVRMTAGGRGLLIRPESRYGLTPRHMDEVEWFASRSGSEG